jgi:hypothetical protein
MIDLRQAIFTLTEEKQQEFISFLDKKNKRKDAKNSEYVRLLLAKNSSSKELSLSLYGKENKVAFHALRKRLFQSLIDFTANISMNEENSTDILLIKQLISARAFLKKGQYKIGYQILNKTKIIAKEHQLFSILHEIYHTEIEYAHTDLKLNIDALVFEFKKNEQQLFLQENLNIAYAKIKNALLKANQNKNIIDIKPMIETTLKKQNIVISDAYSFKSLCQLMQVSAISSSQKFDYWNIEDFIVNTYEHIKNHTSKIKQLYYHIEILYLIANTLFRNKKFDESLEYLDKMQTYMQENKGKYCKEFSVKHDLLLALNYNYKGNQQKAVAILEPYSKQKTIDLVTQLDIKLSLIVFYSQMELFDNSKKIFSTFYHTDKWYIEKAGIIWTIKKNLIEILLHIDLGNLEIVDSRLLSFKRNYFHYLKKMDQEKVIVYLKLVETYFKNPEIITSSKFHEKVENSFNWLEREKEDIFMMSFFAWLKAKMTKKNIYSVTLELVNGV